MKSLRCNRPGAIAPCGIEFFAVGSRSFVEKVKSELGFKASDRQQPRGNRQQ